MSFGRAPCDEGVIRAASETPGCAARARPWVLAATILGSSMAFIDGSVVTVALPAIQADLTTSVAGAQWVANAYMLMLGALILVGGAAGDRFGRRRVFALGIAIFTAASVACGLAPNTAALIVARAVQGIGGALLIPGSLAIISAAFPADERGKAIGTWAGFSALTTAVGPVLGGWLVDTLSWRAIFFINVPIALLTLGLAFWHVPESRNASDDGTVDWRGALLAMLGLAGLVYGLTAASDFDWMDPMVLGVLLGSGLALAIFVWYEARAPSPMMPLGLFRSPVFSGANAITFLLYFALGGILFFLPFNLIRIQGYSATLAGAAFLPFTLIMGGLSRWSGGAHPPLWCAKASDNRPSHRGRRVRIVRAPWHRGILLDDVLPGDGGARSRHGHQRGPAHHDRHGRGREPTRGDGVGHQQRRLPDCRHACNRAPRRARRRSLRSDSRHALGRIAGVA
jgi:MFS family permease